VRTGHGKPGKSCNYFSFSSPGKSRDLISGYGKSWNLQINEEKKEVFFCAACVNPLIPSGSICNQQRKMDS
jgi:hypothetical protein